MPRALPTHLSPPPSTRNISAPATSSNRAALSAMAPNVDRDRLANWRLSAVLRKSQFPCSSASSRSRVSRANFFPLASVEMRLPCGLRRHCGPSTFAPCHFYCCAACLVALSHCLLRGSGHGIVAVKPALEKAPPMSALGQKQTSRSLCDVCLSPRKRTFADWRLEQREVMG